MIQLERRREDDDIGSSILARAVAKVGLLGFNIQHASAFQDTNALDDVPDLRAVSTRVHRDRATDCAGDTAEGFKPHQVHIDAFARENGERRARGAGNGGVHK